MFHSWTNLAGAAALILFGFALLAFVALHRRQRLAAATPAQLEAGRAYSVDELRQLQGFDATGLLSRFVVNGEGERVGETVALHEDRVIVKRDASFFAVPATLVVEKDGTLTSSPEVDWDEAADAGRRWHDATRDEMKYDEQGMPVMDA